MSNNVSIQGLAHIGIFVKNLEASKTFYTEILGAKVIYCFTYEKTNIVFMQIGTCVLELIETKDEVPPDSGPVNHIAFAVKNIESVVEELKEKGIEFEGDEVTFCSDCFENGSKWAVFWGLDGERLEVNERM